MKEYIVVDLETHSLLLLLIFVVIFCTSLILEKFDENNEN